MNEETRAPSSASDPTAIPIQFDPRERRMTGVAVHGDTPFDVPIISQIEGNFWQGGCTSGLVLPTFIQHVISLYPWEQYQVGHQLRSYTFHWLYDANEKPPPIVKSIAAWVRACVKDGPTLLHCQAGLNRSGLVAALVLMHRKARTADEAIALLRAQRSPAVLCNPAFESWLRAGA